MQQAITATAVDDVIVDTDTTVQVNVAINTSSTADSKYDLLSAKNKNVTVQDDDSNALGSFNIDNITRDF